MQQRKRIESLILTLRGQKVILDVDLADIYEVATGSLNQSVKRNAERFPEDFMFQLTAKEWANLKSQFVISRLQVPDNQGDTTDRSQIATSPHGGRRTPPRAFTEHGAIMAATVLNSPQAVAMSVYVVRAFVQMREQIAANAEILKRLAEIDKSLLKHDKSLQSFGRNFSPCWSLRPVRRSGASVLAPTINDRAQPFPTP